MRDLRSRRLCCRASRLLVQPIGVVWIGFRSGKPGSNGMGHKEVVRAEVWRGECWHQVQHDPLCILV